MTDSPIKIILSYNINFKIIIHTFYFRNNLKKKIFQNNYEKNYWEIDWVIEKFYKLLIKYK